MNLLPYKSPLMPLLHNLFQVYITPYSIGYSVLTDATSSALPIASLINKANVEVTASATSVAYAVMDKGGNLNSLLNANLADPSSSNAWPITGFSYYVIRTQTHIGSCERRIAAMKYLYSYYYSDAVKDMAAALGFATLPVFIRDIIAQKLVTTARCNNGQLALSEYNKNPTTIVTSTTFKEIAKSFASVYSAVDSSANWNFVSFEDSRQILSNFTAAPHAVAGVVTMLTGRKEKLKYFNNPNILTFTFSHVPAVIIYHLDYYTGCAHVPLRITNDILIGIYSGTIIAWNDAKIQEANYPFRFCLPPKLIHLVVLSTPSDENSVFYRYLSLISPDFNKSYYSQGGDGSFQYYDFSSVIPNSRLTTVTANAYVDNVILSQDATFGFFLHVVVPTSTVASYCADSACNTPVIAPNDYGASVALCQLDPNTVINPSQNTFTYDLMVSTTVGCYPIVGTVDISMNSVNNKNSCTRGTHAYSIVVNKVKFGAFLFHGSMIIKPLALVSNAPSTSIQRQDAYMSICDQTCNGMMMGYAYCGYRDCSWEGGDYIQLVSGCLAGTQSRHVSYIRTNSTCVMNPLTSPPPVVQISCTHVLPDSSVAIGAIFMAVMGALVCSVILYLSFKYSYEKVLRRSQLIFIYFFLVGAVLMNLTVLCMYGPNSDSNCMLRVWAVNLSSTIMFAPLIMKLHRVDVLFRTLQRGGRRKTISDFTVGLQVLGLFSVDLAILIAWTIIDRPRSILVSSTYKNVYLAIDDLVCSTNINQPFEKAMVAWKAGLLLFGIIKSIQTWEVPKEISEAKHFAIAIYNIAVVGSFSYFLSVFGNVGIDVIVILRCVGIFISATVSAVVIMMPKLVIIQLSWTEVFLGSASSFKEDCSYTSSTPNIPAPQIQDTLDLPRRKVGHSANLMGALTTNFKIRHQSNEDIDMCGGTMKNREVAI
jgi:ABC-type phosphate transport system substrate-binding protein